MIFDKIFDKSKKIAVIFSGNHILKNEFGDLIDSYDEIVRFNRSPTLRFEKNVGSFTSLRVINNGVFQNIMPATDQNWLIDKEFIEDINNSKFLVISPVELNVQIKKKNEINNNIYFYLTQNFQFKLSILSMSKRKDLLLYLHLIIYFYIFRKNLSVGCLTLICLIISGYDVNLFGYDKNEKNTRSHYWETSGKIGKHHNLNFEKIIINNLSKKKIIKIINA